MAISIPKINTNWLLLIAAIGLGIGAVFLSNSLIKRRMADVEAALKQGHQTIQVVVAKRDLARGELLASNTVAVREIPKEYAHEGGIRPDQFDAFENQRLAVAIKRGEEVLAIQTEGAGANVFSSAVKKGFRALTFEVDAVNSVSGLLRPGDRIDLIYTTKANATDNQDMTVPLLSNVSILATDQTQSKRDDGTGKQRTFTTITLEVSPLDADRIIVAKSSGQLTAVLRHPDDMARNATGILSPAMLVGTSAADNGHVIEYIVGGSGKGSADVQLAKLAPKLSQLGQQRQQSAAGAH